MDMMLLGRLARRPGWPAGPIAQGSGKSAPAGAWGRAR